MALRKMQQAAVDKGVSLGFPDAYMGFLRDPVYGAKVYPQLVSFFRACMKNGIPEGDAVSRLTCYFGNFSGQGLFELLVRYWPHHRERVEALDAHLEMFGRIHTHNGLWQLGCILCSKDMVPDIEQWKAFLDALDHTVFPGNLDLGHVLRAYLNLMSERFSFEQVMEALAPVLGEPGVSPEALVPKVREVLESADAANLEPYFRAYPGIGSPAICASGNWHTFFVSDAERERVIRGFLSTGASCGDLELDALMFANGYWKTGRSLVFCFRHGRRVSLECRPERDVPDGVFCKLVPEYMELKLFVHPDGHVSHSVRTRRGDILVPLKFKVLAGFYQEGDREFKKFLGVLLSTLDPGFAKDIRPYLESGVFFPDLSVDEVRSRQYHFLGDACAAKYPDVKGNWNRNDVNLLYACDRVGRYADDASRALLSEFRDPGFLSRAGFGVMSRVTFRGKTSAGVVKFLTRWYTERLGFNTDAGFGKLSQWEQDLVSDGAVFFDYVRACRDTGSKLNFRFKSFRKFHEEYERLEELYRINFMPEVKIPESTVFSTLRKALPPEFVWITSKRRLCREAVEMHHCVSSYAGAINRDECAICSVTISGVRYTCDFRVGGGRYVLSEMRGACNKAPDPVAVGYVESFLEGAVP